MEKNKVVPQRMIQEGITGHVTAAGDPADILQGLLKGCRLDNSRRPTRQWAEQHASRTHHMARLVEILERTSARE